MLCFGLFSFPSTVLHFLLCFIEKIVLFLLTVSNYLDYYCFISFKISSLSFIFLYPLYFYTKFRISLSVYKKAWRGFEWHCTKSHGSSFGKNWPNNVEGLMLYNIFRSNYLGTDFSQQYFIGFSAEIFICFLLNLSLSILLIFYSVILNYYFWLRKIGFGYWFCVL